MNHLVDRREVLRQMSVAGLSCLGGVLPTGITRATETAGRKTLRAGTAIVDITPQKFPVLVCGSFLNRSATRVSDPLFARCLVLDDGTKKLVLMVVDTIGIPNAMDEKVKAAASKATGIPTENMLISATHTHSGGSVLSGLGTKVDPEYSEFLPDKLVECIEKAAANLRPAKIGWSGEDYPAGTHCRIFIRRPDCIGTDPTGRRNVRAMKLQAIRIGDLGIAALPAEVYAITGLKLKLQCPLSDMFNIELANGFLGYIPPPEVRPLGGYNIWPARHTVTQNDTETIFVETLLEMFEDLTGRQRRKVALSQGPFAQRILARKQIAYWRLGEIEANRALDASGNGNHGVYETGYAFYINGPDRDDLRAGGEKPRAVQFVGGRMKTQVDLDSDYTVELFFRNGLPNDNRAVTGYLFSLGPDGGKRCPGDHLGIGGTAGEPDAAGWLFFYNGATTSPISKAVWPRSRSTADRFVRSASAPLVAKRAACLLPGLSNLSTKHGRPEPAPPWVRTKP